MPAQKGEVGGGHVVGGRWCVGSETLLPTCPFVNPQGAQMPCEEPMAVLFGANGTIFLVWAVKEGLIRGLA